MSAKKMPKLLPCPFCGGKASLSSDPYRATIACMECLISKSWESDSKAHAQKMVTEQWNRRALAAKQGKIVARGWLSDYELPFKYELTISANEPESKRPPIRVVVVEDKS